MQSFSSRSDLYKSAGQQSAAAPAQEVAPRFYLTLCPVVAPVTVPEPMSAALRRFRFFFTRETCEGRARYLLQFGYFATEQEARKWREVLGRVYPAAAIRKLAENAPQRDILSASQVLAMLASAAPSPDADAPRNRSPSM